MGMSSVDRAVPVYPIGVVQKLTELSGRQIRYYESVGLFAPYRTKGNQRLYSPDDVDLLLEIKRLLADGLNIEGVRAQLSKTGSGKAAEAETAEPPQVSHIDHDFIVSQMRAGNKLSSLYPVNNQAALARFLQQRREPDEAN